MMRLLLVIPTLDRCGAEKQLVLLATGLPRDEVEVHVAVLTRDGPLRAGLESAGIPVELIRKRWKFDPWAYARLRTLIRRLRPDIVHTWLFAANAYGRQAAFSAGVRCVLAAERCVDRWKRWHELAIDRQLARRTRWILVNSVGVRDFYVRQGLPASKFVVIPNGVPPWCDPSQSTREEVLGPLGVPPGSRVLVAVNRLWPQKRVKDLIWAADLLKSIRDDAYLLIIGDGPQRWRLERFRDQVRIADRVFFLGQRDDVPRILPHADCLWLGSEYEGQSNAILEAMSAGVPVVATDIPGNRELVVPGETGFLVPVGDRGAIARQTCRILEDAELARRFGEAGRRRVQDEFSVARMVARHLAVYHQAMREPSGER